MTNVFDNLRNHVITCVSPSEVQLLIGMLNTCGEQVNIDNANAYQRFDYQQFNNTWVAPHLVSVLNRFISFKDVLKRFNEERTKTPTDTRVSLLIASECL